MKTDADWYASQASSISITSLSQSHLLARLSSLSNSSQTSLVAVRRDLNPMCEADRSSVNLIAASLARPLWTPIRYQLDWLESVH
jgi:hypothetical protein